MFAGKRGAPRIRACPRFFAGARHFLAATLNFASHSPIGSV